MAKRGLGKGLGALLPAAEQEPAAEREGGITEISVAAIEVGRHQPRRRFDEEKIAELAASIKAHGVLQPLVVRALREGRYQLIVGERRLRAAKAAGLETVPCLLKVSDDLEASELALIENLQREDLSPVEEAGLPAHDRRISVYPGSLGPGIGEKPQPYREQHTPAFP